MSNLLVKYGSGSPSREGALAPHLVDFNNVASTGSNGYALGYNSTSSEWESKKLAETSRTVFYHWNCRTNETCAGNTIYTYDANDNTIWRDGQVKIYNTSYVTRVTASGSLVPVVTTAWAQYWTLLGSALNGKRIRLEACHMAHGVTESTEQLVYQWGQGSGNLATYTPIGNKAYQTNEYTQVALGELVMGATNVNVALKVVSISGSASILRGGPSISGGAKSAFASYLTLSIMEG